MEPIGEIVAASALEAEVECHRLYDSPGLGAFVRFAGEEGRGESAGLGVVIGIRTGPYEPTRVVQAHRLPPEELRTARPHLELLLRTACQLRLLGPAGAPPALHAFVYPATAAEVLAATASPAFLRPFVAVGTAESEELLVAVIQSAYAAAPDPRRLREWGRYLARLLVRDYLVLENVLTRLQPLYELPAHPRSTSLEAPRHPHWEEPASRLGPRSE